MVCIAPGLSWLRSNLGRARARRGVGRALLLERWHSIENRGFGRWKTENLGELSRTAARLNQLNIGPPRARVRPILPLCAIANEGSFLSFWMRS